MEKQTVVTDNDEESEKMRQRERQSLLEAKTESAAQSEQQWQREAKTESVTPESIRYLQIVQSQKD